MNILYLFLYCAIGRLLPSNSVCKHYVNIAQGVTFGRGANVSTRASMLPIVTLANQVIIAAGSVLTKDLTDSGNPARKIKGL